VKRDRSRRTQKKSKGVQKMLFAALIAGFVLVTLIGGLISFLVTRDISSAYTGTGFSIFQPVDQGQSTLAPGETPQVTPTLIPVEITPDPWDGKNRVTVLLLGLDYRDWVANQGAPRSDTMMVVSFDPLTQEAGILSIPRDLWVEIPGFGHNRINTAYMFGEAYRLPGGGPALAMQATEDLLGVPIDHYAVVDFLTFERLIDEIGGIDVLVKNRIKIAPIGRLGMWLEAKPYHLDGAETLAYARVRKGVGSGGDFGRAERQQQVAMAVIDRIVGFEMVPILLQKAPSLFQELSTGIRTNMTLDEMISLGWMATQIPGGNIHRGVIAPPNMVGFYTRPDGAQVLRAVPDQIRILRDEIFTSHSAFGPDVSGINP
jgi:polyisoprenyl-teichoic acid--peptidoglycan teichoic acid transferase